MADFRLLTQISPKCGNGASGRLKFCFSPLHDADFCILSLSSVSTNFPNSFSPPSKFVPLADTSSSGTPQ